MRIGLTYNVKSDNGRADEPLLGKADELLLGKADELLLGKADELLLGKADDEEEFDAPETIAALADVLAGLGHQVDLLGDGEPMLRKLLGGPRPDLVLNIAEGQGCSRSREARVPGVLEMLGIPYTGSDPLALAVTLDKDCAKRLVRDAGVATPDWVLVEQGDLESVRGRLDHFDWPLIVKPAYEGSSKGIRSASLVHDPRALEQAVASLADAYRQPILVEEFIEGDELTVGVVGNRPARVLGVMRIVPTRPGPFIYGLEVKRDWRRLVRYECPARLSAADTAAVERGALAAWRALGCRDVARIDFRLKQGTAYFLEANPLPGLSPESGDLVLMAGQLGMTHPELISKILEAAMERQTVEAGCRL